MDELCICVVCGREIKIGETVIPAHIDGLPALVHPGCKPRGSDGD